MIIGAPAGGVAATAETVQAIRATSSTPAVIGILAPRHEGASQAGQRFAAQVTKPVKPALLLDALMAALQRLRRGELRAAPAPEPAVARQLPLFARKSGPTARVLLAEDNHINQKVALTILERLGYRADAVSDGKQALVALARENYDVVLMDVQMPTMDGLEATRRIRAGDEGVRNAQVPIIALTAHITASDREQCEQAGMDEFVSKPVHPERLWRAIERQLAGHRPLQPSAAGPGAASQPAGPQQCDSASGAEEPEAVIDREELLERFEGDRQLCRDLLRLFLKDAPALLRALREAVQRADYGLIQNEAHSLKGAAAYVSARALRRWAAEVEQAARAHDGPRAATLLERISDELQRLRDWEAADDAADLH